MSASGAPDHLAYSTGFCWQRDATIIPRNLAPAAHNPPFQNGAKLPPALKMAPNSNSFFDPDQPIQPVQIHSKLERYAKKKKKKKKTPDSLPVLIRQ